METLASYPDPMNPHFQLDEGDERGHRGQRQAELRQRRRDCYQDAVEVWGDVEALENAEPHLLKGDVMGQLRTGIEGINARGFNTVGDGDDVVIWTNAEVDEFYARLRELRREIASAMRRVKNPDVRQDMRIRSLEIQVDLLTRNFVY